MESDNSVCYCSQEIYTLWAALMKVYDNYKTPLGCSVKCYKSKYIPLNLVPSSGPMPFICWMEIFHLDTSMDKIGFLAPLEWWEKFKIMVVYNEPKFVDLDGQKIMEVLEKIMNCIRCGFFPCVCKDKEWIAQQINPIKQKPRIPEFLELLDASKVIHLKKNQDYANESNPFSNFERSAELISWFNNPIDKSFMGLIGTKLARIAELSDGRIPNNESLDDSFLDLVTYCALWGAYNKRQRNKK